MFFFFFSKPYISIIGEMVDFKNNADSTQIQKKLNTVLKYINREYETGIAGRFMATAGGEFQGLLESGNDLMKIILDLKNKMHPVKLRFGLGVGEITDGLDFEMPLLATGPCKDKSKEALMLLQNHANKNQSGMADVRMEAVGEHSERMRLVNTVFSLLTTLECGWSSRQREIICNIMKYQDHQSDVARRLGITQSTVQKSLTAAHYYTYKDALDTLNTIFSEIGEQTYDES